MQIHWKQVNKSIWIRTQSCVDVLFVVDAVNGFSPISVASPTSEFVLEAILVGACTLSSTPVDETLDGDDEKDEGDCCCCVSPWLL